MNVFVFFNPQDWKANYVSELYTRVVRDVRMSRYCWLVCMCVCVFVCLYIGDVDRTSHESHEEQREDDRGESQYGWIVSLSYCSNILDEPVQDFKTDLVIRRIIVCMSVSALMVPELNITTKLIWPTFGEL